MQRHWQNTKVGWIVLGIILGVLWPLGAAADCPGARELRIQGQLQVAENQARRCVELYPLDADNLAELARVLAAKTRYQEALEKAQRASQLSPDDPSLTLLVARIHAWRGDMRPALDEMKRFPAAGLTDRSATLFRARLSLWASEYDDAVAWFSRFLQGEPDQVEALYGRGIALESVGNKKAALIDFERACELGGAQTRACEAEEKLRKEIRPRFLRNVYAQTEFTAVQDRGEGWSLFGLVTLQPAKGVFVSPSAEVRTRPFPDRDYTDWQLRLDATMPVAGPLQLRVGGQYSPDATFFPNWGAHVAPHLVVGVVDLGLRYWHIEFEQAGVEVLNPTAVWYFGQSLLDARYYLAFEEDGLSHAALARYGVGFGPVMAYAGVGAGNRSDFVELRDVDVERHWLVLGKLSWEFLDRNTVSLGSVHRRDISGEADYIQTQFLLGFERGFGP